MESLEDSVSQIQDRIILEKNRELLLSLEKADLVSNFNTVLDIFRETFYKINEEVEEKNREKLAKEKVLATVFKEKIIINDVKPGIGSFKELKQRIFQLICEKYVVLKYNPKILLFTNACKLKYLEENVKPTDFLLRDYKNNKIIMVEFLLKSQLSNKSSSYYELLKQVINREYLAKSKKEFGKAYENRIGIVYILFDDDKLEILSSLAFSLCKTFINNGLNYESLEKCSPNISGLSETPWNFSKEDIMEFSNYIAEGIFEKKLGGKKIINQLSSKGFQTKAEPKAKTIQKLDKALTLTTKKPASSSKIQPKLNLVKNLETTIMKLKEKQQVGISKTNPPQKLPVRSSLPTMKLQEGPENLKIQRNATQPTKQIKKLGKKKKSLKSVAPKKEAKVVDDDKKEAKQDLVTQDIVVPEKKEVKLFKPNLDPCSDDEIKSSELEVSNGNSENEEKKSEKSKQSQEEDDGEGEEEEEEEGGDEEDEGEEENDEEKIEDETSDEDEKLNPNEKKTQGDKDDDDEEDGGEEEGDEEEEEEEGDELEEEDEGKEDEDAEEEEEEDGGEEDENENEGEDEQEEGDDPEGEEESDASNDEEEGESKGTDAGKNKTNAKVKKKAKASASHHGKKKKNSSPEKKPNTGTKTSSSKSIGRQTKSSKLTKK